MLNERKPLNAATIKAMKPDGKHLSDIDKNEGLSYIVLKQALKYSVIDIFVIDIKALSLINHVKLKLVDFL